MNTIDNLKTKSESQPLFKGVILLFMLLVLPFILSAQATKVKLKFNIVQTEKEIQFSVETLTPQKRSKNPVSDVGVYLFNVLDTTEIALGSTVTDAEGRGNMVVDKNFEFLADEEGRISFVASVQEGEKYAAVEKSLSINLAYMEVSFTEIDSVKTIVVTGYGIGADGSKVPISDVDVYFYVPRSFSQLQVGDGWFDNGEATGEFPVTLPGDTLGNLTILAMIEDDERYGTIQAKAEKDWGVVRPRVIVEKRRGLGDTDAPIWMVYTLIVLLTMVWFHYFFVFYSIYRIKKEGKR